MFAFVKMDVVGESAVAFGCPQGERETEGDEHNYGDDCPLHPPTLRRLLRSARCPDDETVMRNFA